jgi:AcrR family transcriptional regulator
VSNCYREMAAGEPDATLDPVPDASAVPLASVRELRPGRQRMLDVARRLFSTGGYQRTPLRAISEDLGVTKAAVYYHFKAKDELLVAIVAPLLARIDEVLDDPPPTSDRRAFLRRYVEVLSSEPDVAALLLQDPAVRNHPLGHRFADQHSRLRAVLGAGEGVVDELRTATALRACELAVVEFGVTDPGQVQETAVDIAMAVLGTGPHVS